jgi:hypothetical protein
MCTAFPSRADLRRRNDKLRAGETEIPEPFKHDIIFRIAPVHDRNMVRDEPVCLRAVTASAERDLQFAGSPCKTHIHPDLSFIRVCETRDQGMSHKQPPAVKVYR